MYNFSNKQFFSGYKVINSFVAVLLLIIAASVVSCGGRINNTVWESHGGTGVSRVSFSKSAFNWQGGSGATNSGTYKVSGNKIILTYQNGSVIAWTISGNSIIAHDNSVWVKVR